MQINFQNDTQIKNGCQTLQALLYKEMHEASETKWIPYVAPLMELTSSLMTIISRIGLIVENILKGLANIAIGTFNSKEQVIYGAKQLTLGTLKNTFLLLYSVGCAFFELINGAFNQIVGNLNQYSQNRWYSLDPASKDFHQKRLELENQILEDQILKDQMLEDRNARQLERHQQLEGEFKRLVGLANEENPDAEVLFQLALFYRDGKKVIAPNQQSYFLYLKQAADLGHPEAIAIYAPIHAEQERLAEVQAERERRLAASRAQTEQLRLAREAAAVEDRLRFNELKASVESNPLQADAIFELAQCYRTGRGCCADSHLYVQHLEKAAGLNHGDAIAILQAMAEERATQIRYVAEGQAHEARLQAERQAQLEEEAMLLWLLEEQEKLSR